MLFFDKIMRIIFTETQKMPALANIFAAAQADDTRDIREVIEQTDVFDEAMKADFLRMAEIGFLPEEEQKLRNTIFAYEQKKADAEAAYQKKVKEILAQLDAELFELSRKKKQEWNTAVEKIATEDEEKQLEELEGMFDEIE